jgi:hypothetical protein
LARPAGLTAAWWQVLGAGAKLLTPTDAGREAIGRIGPGHARLAGLLAAELGEDGFAETVRVLERLSKAMDAVSEKTVTEQ